jgi:hypothetical protein
MFFLSSKIGIANVEHIIMLQELNVINAIFQNWMEKQK